MANGSQVMWAISATLGGLASLLAFGSVCGYLLNQDGCAQTVHNSSYTELHSVTPIENGYWATYSWVTLATLSMILIHVTVKTATIKEEDKDARDCASALTRRIVNAFSLIFLTAQGVMAGVLIGMIDESCKGDSKNGLLGLSIAVCALSFIALVLMAASSFRKGNAGNKYADVRARHRRARQFP